MKISSAIDKDWGAVLNPDFTFLGIGYDVATTTKKVSNPSALAVTQQCGNVYFVRLLLRWKTSDPAVAEALLKHVLDTIPPSYRVRRICIDGTSEKYFAAAIRRRFAPRVPVSIVVSSESTDYLGEPMNFKLYLGNLLVNTIQEDGGRLAVPRLPWVQKDFRSVTREKGTFDAEILEDGGHGDCFDAVKLSLHALCGKGGPVQAEAASVGAYKTAGAQKERFPARPDRSEDSPGTGVIHIV